MSIFWAANPHSLYRKIKNLRRFITFSLFVICYYTSRILFQNSRKLNQMRKLISIGGYIKKEAGKEIEEKRGRERTREEEVKGD